ncbi:MAG: MBL fold metallo-hydrolase [Deltaproteobacteria bacterium]|nr:MAG: MBL fold metallo-hydrolase [Deltaproteobacteria bacterium]
MKLTFWGVRGSIPVPGPTTRRWGGNSSCLAVHHQGKPSLILDCGTGARALGGQLVRAQGRQLGILFTHFHVDHIIGFPFFAPLYTPGFDVQIAVPATTEHGARERIEAFLNGRNHPVRLRDMPASISFYAIRPEASFDFLGYTVRAVLLNHPGGSCGYRIEAGGRSICYVTDTAPFATPGEGLLYDRDPTAGERRMLRFLAGADLVVYDTMYELPEYLEKMTWGHSYPEYARELCRAAGVQTLYLFHHAPDASDDLLDARAESWAGASEPRVRLAREGDTVDLGSD